MASARTGSQPATDPPAPGRNPVAEARRRALVAGRGGDVEKVLGLLGHGEAGVRVSALGALAAAGALDPSILQTFFRDPALQVRRRACELAGRQHGPTTQRASATLVVGLQQRLEDDEPLVVEAAAWALGELVDADMDADADRDTLTSCLRSLSEIATRHSDALCREAAVAALGAIGHESSLGSVMAALEDRPPVRRRATVALAAFSDPRADEALRRCLTDRDWQVRQAAEDLLGVRPPP